MKSSLITHYIFFILTLITLNSQIKQSTTQDSNTHTSHGQDGKDQKENIDPIKVNTDELLNMDENERDKILACSEIIAIKLKKDHKIIDELTQNLKVRLDPEYVNQKIAGDLFNKCYYSIEDSTVDTIFFNNQYMEPEYTEDLLENAGIDYNVYRTLQEQDFNISPETQILFMKLEKARTDYIAKNKSTVEKNKNEFRIFGYSLKEIPLGLNMIIFIAIFTIFIGGLLFMLKLVSKNDKKAAGR